MLKNIPRDDVLKVVREKGPTIPARIVKELGGDTLLIGAILSDLTENKLAYATFLKYGGTPFYYVSGQEEKLQDLVQHMNEKDRRTFELLKEKKILEDVAQEPLTRVSLRTIKDFAKPLEIRIKEEKKLFWKFYLTADEEALKLIKEYLKSKVAVKTEVKVEEKKPEPVKEPQEKKEVKEIKEEKTEKETKKEPKEIKSDFLEKVLKYFADKNIEVVEKTVTKKSEIDFIVKIPSPVGNIEYFCKAKDKKTINDGDLASAYVIGQNKKLPILFLSSGELTKKAKEMLTKEFKGMNFNKI